MSEFRAVDILYAEDSVTDAEVTLRALHKVNLGNNLLWVKDGLEALDALLGRGSYAGQRRTAPRLALLDLKMPKIDGLDVLRTIRATERLRSLPVVMLTSSAEKADLVASYELGANSYIVKPVDSTRLSDEVARLGYYWLLINRLPESGS